MKKTGMGSNAFEEREAIYVVIAGCWIFCRNSENMTHLSYCWGSGLPLAAAAAAWA
jgi:hypothetical protein